MRTLILSTFLYACESWTLTAEIERGIQALEMRCYRRLLNISYKDHVTNEEVRNRIQNAWWSPNQGKKTVTLMVWPHLKILWHGEDNSARDSERSNKERKTEEERWEDNIKEWTGIGFRDSLRAAENREGWEGIVSRSSGMAKTILQGTVKGARRRGRQQKRWEDNIKEWTGMGFGDSLKAAEDREGWKGIVATSSVVPRGPPRLRDWDEMRCTLTLQKLSMDVHSCVKFSRKMSNQYF